MFVRALVVVPSAAETLGIGLALLAQGKLLWDMPGPPEGYAAWTVREDLVGKPLAFVFEPPADADTLVVRLREADHSHRLELWGPETPTNLPYEEWGTPLMEIDLPQQPSTELTAFTYDLGAVIAPAPPLWVEALSVGAMVVAVGTAAVLARELMRRK